MSTADILTFSNVFESFGNGTENKTRSRICLRTERTVSTDPTESRSCETHAIHNIVDDGNAQVHFHKISKSLQCKQFSRYKTFLLHAKHYGQTMQT